MAFLTRSLQGVCSSTTSSLLQYGIKRHVTLLHSSPAMERIRKGMSNRRKEWADYVSIQDAIDRLIKYGEIKKQSSNMKKECKYLIHSIRRNVDDIKVEQITIMDSILRRMPFLEDTVGQALRSVLPHVLKQPNNKAVSLNGSLSLLTYVVRTEVYIPDKTEQIEQILKSLCDFTYDIDIQKASRMFKLLELVAEDGPKGESAETINHIVQLCNAKFIGQINDLSLDDVLSLISLYKDSINIVRDSDLLWTLCERITDRCLTDGENSSKIIEIFSILSGWGYSDINVIFKLDKLFENDPNLLTNTEKLVQVLRCYAMFDCKSPRWDDLILPAINDNLLATTKGPYLAEITKLLILLGHPPNNAIEAVLSPRFVNEFAAKIYKTPKLQTLLKAIYWYAKQKQNDDGVKFYVSNLAGLQKIFDHNRKLHRPLDSMISEQIGKNKILNNVSTRHGGLWNVVKVNKKTMELTDFHLTSPADNDRIPVENITIEPDEQLLIILHERTKIFATRCQAEIARKAYLQMFERLFYPVVDIDERTVQFMPHDQRKSYIINKIHEKLKELE